MVRVPSASPCIRLRSSLVVIRVRTDRWFSQARQLVLSAKCAGGGCPGGASRQILTGSIRRFGKAVSVADCVLVHQAIPRGAVKERGDCVELVLVEKEARQHLWWLRLLVTQVREIKVCEAWILSQTPSRIWCSRGVAAGLSMTLPLRACVTQLNSRQTLAWSACASLSIVCR
jgi:hypothetical protein